ncbi:MAG: RING finger domain-containing protein [Candidatus Kariarchaeaceae archaeon]
MYNCSICKNSFTDPNESISCHCGETFHKNHLATWVASHNFCPICRSGFTNTFVDNILQEVNPENFDEELLTSFRIDQENEDQMRRESEIVEQKTKNQELVNPDGGSSRLFSINRNQQVKRKKPNSYKGKLTFYLILYGIPIVAFLYLTNSGENP